MKLLKIANLVVLAYALIVGLCFLLLDPNQRRTGDIFIRLFSLSVMRSLSGSVGPGGIRRLALTSP